MKHFYGTCCKSASSDSLMFALDSYKSSTMAPISKESSSITGKWCLKHKPCSCFNWLSDSCSLQVAILCRPSTKQFKTPLPHIKVGKPETIRSCNNYHCIVKNRPICSMLSCAWEGRLVSSVKYYWIINHPYWALIQQKYWTHRACCGMERTLSNDYVMSLVRRTWAHSKFRCCSAEARMASSSCLPSDIRQ